MPKFAEFPKIARLNREVIVTEKIDGTNASVHVSELTGTDEDYEDVTRVVTVPRAPVLHVSGAEGSPPTRRLMVRAGSRTGFVTPSHDNHGFAAWVYENAEDLAFGLGVGIHFGEWYGSGINRGYGLQGKRFALFNVSRWVQDRSALLEEGQAYAPRCCLTVPVLGRGVGVDRVVEECLAELAHGGSHAVPGYDRPEGVVVYHTASNGLFKVTLDGDAEPKSKSQQKRLKAQRTIVIDSPSPAALAEALSKVPAEPVGKTMRVENHCSGLDPHHPVPRGFVTEVLCGALSPDDPESSPGPDDVAHFRTRSPDRI